MFTWRQRVKIPTEKATVQIWREHTTFPVPLDRAEDGGNLGVLEAVHVAVPEQLRAFLLKERERDAQDAARDELRDQRLHVRLVEGLGSEARGFG